MNSQLEFDLLILSADAVEAHDLEAQSAELRMLAEEKLWRAHTARRLATVAPFSLALSPAQDLQELRVLIGAREFTKRKALWERRAAKHPAKLRKVVISLKCLHNL